MCDDIQVKETFLGSLSLALKRNFYNNIDNLINYVNASKNNKINEKVFNDMIPTILNATKTMNKEIIPIFSQIVKKVEKPVPAMKVSFILE